MGKQAVSQRASASVRSRQSQTQLGDFPSQSQPNPDGSKTVVPREPSDLAWAFSGTMRWEDVRFALMQDALFFVITFTVGALVYAAKTGSDEVFEFGGLSARLLEPAPGLLESWAAGLAPLLLTISWVAAGWLRDGKVAHKHRTQGSQGGVEKAMEVQWARSFALPILVLCANSSIWLAIFAIQDEVGAIFVVPWAVCTVVFCAIKRSQKDTLDFLNQVNLAEKIHKTRQKLSHFSDSEIETLAKVSRARFAGSKALWVPGLLLGVCFGGCLAWLAFVQVHHTLVDFLGPLLVLIFAHTGKFVNSLANFDRKVASFDVKIYWTLMFWAVYFPVSVSASSESSASVSASSESSATRALVVIAVSLTLGAVLTSVWWGGLYRDEARAWRDIRECKEFSRLKDKARLDSDKETTPKTMTPAEIDRIISPFWRPAVYPQPSSYDHVSEAASQDDTLCPYSQGTLESRSHCGRRSICGDTFNFRCLRLAQKLR